MEYIKEEFSDSDELNILEDYIPILETFMIELNEYFQNFFSSQTEIQQKLAPIFKNYLNNTK